MGLTFDQDENDDSSNSPEKQQGREKAADAIAGGIRVRVEGVDLSLSAHRPQAMPECAALARLAQVPTLEVLSCMNQKSPNRYGAVPAVYRWRTAHCVTEVVASLLEVGPLDAKSVFLQASVKSSGEALGA